MSEIDKALTGPRLTRTVIDRKDLLSTGSTLLNLACTGYPEGGLWKGGYFFVVGDSSAGKTFLTRTCLAEASINKEFDEYRLIYDDAEGGALMDTRKYFGKALADRLEPPSSEDGRPVYSVTDDDLYFHLDDAVGVGKPFIYVIGSQDALTSDYEGKKFQERKSVARGRKRSAAGDYGDGKAKRHSSGIRSILPHLRDMKSILIMENQTRDNVSGGLFDEKSIYSGGRALRFYANIQLWMRVGGTIKKTVRGKDRKIGIVSRVLIKKNRGTGRDRTIEFPIYYSMGIDDIGSCVSYLTDEKHWRRTREGVIHASDFGVQMNERELIKHIEDEGLEFDLRQIVVETWEEVEKSLEIPRKPRY